MTTSIQHVESLDIESLPHESITRLMVHLVDDGLGQPISVPMLVARGGREGPTIGLTCALHGNELNGIPVVHRLFERLDLRALRGTVAAVLVAYVPGFHRQQRYYMDGADLNHLLPGRPNGDVARVYVHRLFVRIVSHFDLLVDMHTASTGRVNSLYIRADMTEPATAQMAYLQRPQIIVHNPPHDGTLRGAASDLGIPAITLEIGNPQRFQADMIKRSLIGLRSVLAAAGMVSRKKVAPGPPPIVCQQSYWTYTDVGGLLVIHPGLVDLVERGERYARLTNIYGDVVNEYEAPEDGVVIGKNVDPVAPTGARLLHLGIVGGDSPLITRQDAEGALEEYRP